MYHTQYNFMQNMKNILVTGGAGFIGSHTVVELRNAGYQPIIIDDFSNSDPSILSGIEAILQEKLIVYKGSCLDERFLSTVFSSHAISGVIHFAAFKSVSESIEKPLLYWENNIYSLLSVLRASLIHNVRAFVFSSSATVYGEPDRLPLLETDPRKPATCAYGATKQAGEDMVQNACLSSSTSLKGISLRYFNPIGAHPSGRIGELPLGPPQNLVPFLTQTVFGLRDELTVFGNDYPTPDGTCQRDYIHVIDLAQAHICALARLFKETSPHYDVFNIGNGKAISVLDVIQTFENVTHKKVPYHIGPRRNGDVVSCYAKVTKANKLLGWKAKKSLEQALKDAWNWQGQLKKLL